MTELIGRVERVESSDAILDFWFGADASSPEGIAARARVWFGSDAAFDDAIRARFDGLPARAAEGLLDAWKRDARGNVALVIVLDQLPRNLYRGTAQCFSFDDIAYDAAVAACERGLDAEVSPLEALFLYLPLEHREDAAAQAHCVSLVRGLVDRCARELRPQFDSFLSYAIRHQTIIERFGRFPHRNAVLCREPTPEETAFLEAGGDTF